MKVGDLVTVYYGSRHPEDDFWIDTTGLVLAILGHKTEVLVGDEVQNWDISDLIQMKREKDESR